MSSVGHKLYAFPVSFASIYGADLSIHNSIRIIQTAHYLVNYVNPLVPPIMEHDQATSHMNVILSPFTL